MGLSLQESCLPGIRRPAGRGGQRRHPGRGKLNNLSLLTWWTKGGDVFEDHTNGL